MSNSYHPITVVEWWMLLIDPCIILHKQQTNRISLIKINKCWSKQKTLQPLERQTETNNFYEQLQSIQWNMILSFEINKGQTVPPSITTSKFNIVNRSFISINRHIDFSNIGPIFSGDPLLVRLSLLHTIHGQSLQHKEQQNTNPQQFICEFTPFSLKARTVDKTRLNPLRTAQQ